MKRQKTIPSMCIVLLACQCTASAENWAGWRGPNRNGISSETGIPIEWNQNDGIRWKTPLVGSGISNPVVWDDKVIVTASDGQNLSNLHVICLSRGSGKELWHARMWGTAPTRHHGSKSSMASPSPLTDGKHVFAFFGTGDLFCLDMHGDLIWQRSLAAEYGAFENRFAASSSPVLFRDTILLQCDHYGDSYLLAVDQASGANRWKTDRAGYWLSWASPQLVKVNDPQRYEFVVSGSQKLEGYDATNGKKLWTVRGMRRECIPTPLLANGLIFAVSGPQGPSMAIRTGGNGDVTDTHVIWQNTRGAPFVPSAILVGNRYYLVDDDGIGTCLDATNGKRLWQHRFNGRFTASPVSADGNIYFMDESGATVVIDGTSKELREIARNELHEPIFASAAISQKCLFVRTTKHVFCIGQK